MGKGGKSGGKLLFSVLGFAIGGFWGGISKFVFSQGVLGASLFGSIWSATHKPDTGNLSSPEVQRFDKAQETMSSTATIPVVYGYRKITGNQTYHSTNADQNVLKKHVVLCEGGIQGIESVSANDLLIPTNGQTSNTVFTIQNTMYSDASCRKVGKHLYLYCNGHQRDLYLANKDDASSADTLWSWQTSVPELITYINKLGEGWQAFPTATTSKYPGDLWEIGTTNCYKRTVNVQASTVTGNTWYVFRDCQAPSNYEETGAYPMMSWLDMQFAVSNELNGNPSVSCFIKGKKVLDTRTGKTEYSTNPAMCLRDFILSKRYGLGKWINTSHIDEDSFKEAADYCDEIITYKGSSGETISCKRYELNIIIDQKQSAFDWITDILGNFCGFLVFSQDKLFLKIEKPEATSYKFNDSNCSNLSVALMPLDDTPNRYEVTFIDPLNNWTSVEAIVEDFADQKARQKIISKSVSLEGTTSQNQALRLARFYRDYNAICYKTVSFKTGQQALHLEPGDVIELSYHNVSKDEPFRITEIRENEDGTFEISARGYNKNIYNDYLGSTIQVYSYANKLSSLSSSVPDIKGITLSQAYYVNGDGTVVSDIYGKLQLPTYEYFHRAFIYYSLDDGLSWNYYGSTSGDEFVINNAKTQTYYQFKIVVENTSGRRSEGFTSNGYYITGKDEAPSNVTEGRVWYDPDSTQIQLIWEAVPDKDINYYEIVDENSNIIGRTNVLSFNYYIDDDNPHDFYIYAVDNGGNRSLQPLVLTAQRNITCDAPISFTVVQDGTNRSQVNLSWDYVEDAIVKEYAVYVNGTKVTTTNENHTTYIVPSSGYYVFELASVSIFDTESNRIFPTISPDNNMIGKAAIGTARISGTSSTDSMYIKIEPDDVTGFMVTQSETDRTNLRFSWDETNYAFNYELRVGNTWDTATAIGRTNFTTFTYQIQQEGVYKFLIKAIGYNNAYSVNAREFNTSMSLKPDIPTNITITQNPKDKSQIYISWTPPAGHDIAGYQIFINNEFVDSTLANNYTYTVDKSQEITIGISAYTASGFESNRANSTSYITIEPANVTSFSGTQNIAKKSELHLYWSAPEELDISHYELRMGESWDNSTLVSKYITNTYYDLTITVEQTFHFWLKAVSVAGHYSLYPAHFECSFNLNPSAPTNLKIEQDKSDKSTINISWDAVNEFDISYYEVRLGYVWDTAETLVTTTNTRFSFKPDSDSGNIKIIIKAVNSSGFYSDEASASLYALYEPADVQNFTAYQNGDYVDFIWDKSSEVDVVGYEIREGYSWDNANVICTMIPTTSYETKISFEGTYKYMIKAINRAGYYSVNAPEQYVQVRNLSERNIILRINESENKNGTHNHTEFVQSTLNWQTVGGRFSDYDDMMFSEIGGSNVLRLEKYNNSLFYADGVYTCNIVDVGKEIVANIACRFHSTSSYTQGVSARVEMRTSKDNETWTNWTTFAEAQYSFRYVQIRCVLSAQKDSGEYSTTTPEVNTLELVIDLPDREITGELDVPVGGAIVTYPVGKEFYIVPIVTPYALGYGIRCEISDKTVSSFKVRVLDLNNEDVGGHVNWRSRGY